MCNEWREIETAPKDGTCFQAEIPGHGNDNVIRWVWGFEGEHGTCGAWVMADEQEPPESWSDGVCWEVNEDLEKSVDPTQWKPLPEPPVSHGLESAGHTS